MKLLFKQRVFSWFDKYDIFDVNDEVIYRIEGKMAWGRKLVIYDKEENHIATIEKVLLTFLPTYKLYINGEEVGTIKKEFTFFKPKFIVNYNGWSVEGDFWDWNYEILKDREQIAVINTEFFTISDVYTIEVFDEKNLLQSVMVMLAIDAIKDDNSKSGN